MVCDESSILKNFDGVTRQAITDLLRNMRYRLLCTATAAPNDYIELGTSSEALGELGYTDMLTRFFKNDEGDDFAVIVFVKVAIQAPLGAGLLALAVLMGTSRADAGRRPGLVPSDALRTATAHRTCEPRGVLTPGSTAACSSVPHGTFKSNAGNAVATLQGTIANVSRRFT